jgi:protein-S-isoprenylcysteine O-methyltransferase Ste14
MIRILGREAPECSPGANLARTLLQAALFWAFFFWLLPSALFWLEGRVGLPAWRFGPTWSRITGIVLFTLGGSLGLGSAIALALQGAGTPLPLDCPRKLVIRGPYRFVRNPMAVAAVVQGVAVGLMLGSPFVIGYAVFGGPVWHFLVRPWEEADLERRFGEEYREYRRRVRCWLPLR